MGMRANILNRKALSFFCAAASLGHAQSKPAADLIITNAKISTVDKSLPTAQAVTVIGERIVAVGSNADAETWRGLKTQVIDGYIDTRGFCYTPTWNAETGKGPTRASGMESAEVRGTIVSGIACGC